MNTEEQIAQKTSELVKYLNEIKDENQSLAEFSAEVLQRDLNRFLSAKSKNQKLLALSSLENSIGSKGILDSAWTPENLKQIKTICFDLSTLTNLYSTQKPG